MADKPSRGLVLYGDGLARFIDPSHTHLHSFASQASCGFLSLPHSPPSETEDARVLREFLHLVDAYEDSMNMGDIESLDNSVTPTISERFMGVRAAIITNNSSLSSFGNKLGFSVLQLDDLGKSSPSFAESSADLVTSELLKLLGFQGGKISETSQFDLVFIRIGACAEANVADIKYFNAFVGEIMAIAQPGSEIGSRLHVSVVLSYGATSDDDDSTLSISTMNENNDSNLSLLFPRQSYTVKGSNLRKNVRHHCPMLIAQRQNAVTRKDMAETFSFQDFKEHGGNLIIPADRFIHEVAFKLWKAPKYGA